jgi:hypothetical protein
MFIFEVIKFDHFATKKKQYLDKLHNLSEYLINQITKDEKMIVNVRDIIVSLNK